MSENAKPIFLARLELSRVRSFFQPALLGRVVSIRDLMFGQKISLIMSLAKSL